MRRNTSNKFSLILILLVGLFTLTSYAFDQLAVQTEDTIRKTSIRLDNQKVELFKLNSLMSDVKIIKDNSEAIFKNSLIFRNLWIKSLLINEKIKKKEITNIFKDLNYSEDEIIKSRLIETFLEKMADNFKIDYELNEFYFRNQEYLIDINEDDFNKHYKLKDIIKRNNNLLKHKDMDYSKLLYDNFYTGENRKKAHKNFDFEHWLDIHSLTIIMIKNIDEGTKKFIIPNLKHLDNLTSKKRDERKINTNKLKKITANKNQFILLSIISQILSLLFLLIFFRNIIINHKL